MLKNSPDQIIKDLIEDNRRKEEVIERLKWRCRNQKAEIRRLNTAHIVKNNIVRSQTATINAMASVDAMQKVLVPTANSPKVGGCCGSGSCHD